MKTTITSNGEEIKVILEAENPLEKAITDSIELYRETTTVSRPEEGKLSINIKTR